MLSMKSNHQDLSYDTTFRSILSGEAIPLSNKIFIILKLKKNEKRILPWGPYTPPHTDCVPGTSGPKKGPSEPLKGTIKREKKSYNNLYVLNIQTFVPRSLFSSFHSFPRLLLPTFYPLPSLFQKKVLCP